jgi:hypothetical protein
MGVHRMKYFGTKQRVIADADEAALGRLTAIASRYRVEPEPEIEVELPLDFPEPPGEPEVQQ